MYPYRGFSLDSVRHMQSIDEIKKLIDAATLLKFNKFHWHLTDDQGWRIEIKKYPELTEIGSIRRETLVGHHHTSKEYDGIPAGNYKVVAYINFSTDQNYESIQENTLDLTLTVK